MQFDPTARRRFVRLLGASALALGAVVPAVWAQAPAWPDKPLKLLVGFPAGGASDLMARLVADRLGAALGQPVVVDNRPGAAGTLAASLAAKAARLAQNARATTLGCATSPRSRWSTAIR